MHYFQYIIVCNRSIFYKGFLFLFYFFKEGGLQGGSKKTSVAGDSHSKSKKAKVAGENSNMDQSSTHVLRYYFFE